MASVGILLFKKILGKKENHGPLHQQKWVALLLLRIHVALINTVETLVVYELTCAQ